MRLSVHDLITYNGKELPEDAMLRTKNFVQEIEKMNYHRYWFAEHHNAPNHGSSSPEIIAAYMAGVTERLRLGTGGTMIMHYSPLKIAENFKTLSALAPGRVDIGLGRAPGSGPKEIIALAEGRPVDQGDLYDKIEVILNYFLDAPMPGFYGETQAMPVGIQEKPQPWMLGSSGQSALKAADMGLGYSFAKFFSLETDPQVFKLYRDNFQPSEFFAKPEVIVSYEIIIADTEEEANYYAKPLEISRLALRQNKVILNADPEMLKDVKYSQADQNMLESYYDKRFLIKGTPEQVQLILEEEIETLGIDEIMVYAPIFDDQARINSYRHLSEIFNLI